MIHYMKLNPDPFRLIACGNKTIELRLNDEKRKLIKVGDIIKFTNTEESSMTLLATVIALHPFPSFDELYSALPIDKCGYLPENIHTASPKDMELYYTKDKQKKYGVLGIEIKLI